MTLGRFQSPDSVDLVAARVARRGCRATLRPAGAACCTTTSSPMRSSRVPGDGVPRGVAASYRYLCAAACRGVPAAWRGGRADRARPPVHVDGGVLPRHHAGRPLAGGAQALGLGAGLVGRHRASARLLHHLARCRTRGEDLQAEPAAGRSACRVRRRRSSRPPARASRPSASASASSRRFGEPSGSSSSRRSSPTTSSRLQLHLRMRCVSRPDERAGGGRRFDLKLTPHAADAVRYNRRQVQAEGRHPR